MFPSPRNEKSAVFKSRQLLSLFTCVLILLQQIVLLVSPIVVAQGTNTISLTALRTAYTQGFNALAKPPATTGTALPQGFVIAEAGTNADSTYAVSDGSSNAGNTYSFGTTTAPDDRALGSVASGSLQSTFGAIFTNNTDSTINSLTISYTGEEYRYGGRTLPTGSANAPPDMLNFQYSQTAGSLTDTSFVDFAALGFSSPNTAGATAKALDGNAPGNRTAISATITNLNIASGTTFAIRFVDLNIAGNDDGLAIDDFSIMPDGVSSTPAPTPTPTPILLAIHDIQGSGTVSPFTGQVVTTSGIVTALRSNGFFLQTPDVDNNPNTSEGVFVFMSSKPTVSPGDSVTVRATVQEFASSSDPGSPTETELAASPIVTVTSNGNALPAPVTLTIADTSVNDIDNLEKYEGMRVHVDSLTAISPTQGTVNEPNATSTSNGTFYAVITGTARPFREPGIQVPDPVPASPSSGTPPPNVPRFDANPERLRIDSDAQPGTTKLEVTSGAIITNVTGVLDYGFRTYTILPDAATVPTVTNVGSAVPVPVPAANELTVASSNLERFFDTVNDAGTSDAVLTQAALNNRLNKASLLIRNVLRTPDVLGVEEMENLTTLQALATKINNDAAAANQPNPNYQAYLEEGNDIGGIDVGFLVKAARVNVLSVTQIGKNTTYINPKTNTAETLNDRPPLVLRATIAQPGGTALAFTVIVLHNRSLSGVDDPVDGARIRAKRQQQAEFVAKYVQSEQTNNPAENLIVVGDYNAFQFNDGLVDVVGTIKGTPAPPDQVVLASSDLVNPDLIDLIDTLPANERYSFSFDGNAQAIDHALVNTNFFQLLSRFAYARNNADFPESLRNDPNRPERIADHDPEVAYFTLATATPSPTPVPIPPAQSFFSFGAANYTVAEGSTPMNSGSVQIVVRRTGESTAAATVDYATSDGTASGRTDYITATGALSFAAGETTKTFNVFITDDVYVEQSETFTVALSNARGGAAGGAVVSEPSTTRVTITDNDTATPSTNPIDTTDFFVRQQYRDFLNREPEAGGLAYWKTQIDGGTQTSDLKPCATTDAACLNSRRVSVSAAFFISAEFQQTGYFVYRVFKASTGRQLTYLEYTKGRSLVLGGTDLAASQNMYAQATVNPAYNNLSNADYVDQLFRNAVVTPAKTERDALIDGLTAGTETRATVLQKVADNQSFQTQDYNAAFVLAEYFGYLRRDPEAGGYQFWLDVLNNRVPNNYRSMVCAFINSAEYQLRFSPVVTKDDKICSQL